MQANVLVPPIFIAHDPQIPSRHDRRNVKVGSISFLILMSASNIIGPQLILIYIIIES
jgi:hypothetical protein